MLSFASTSVCVVTTKRHLAKKGKRPTIIPIDYIAGILWASAAPLGLFSKSSSGRQCALEIWYKSTEEKILWLENGSLGLRVAAAAADDDDQVFFLWRQAVREPVLVRCLTSYIRGSLVKSSCCGCCLGIITVSPSQNPSFLLLHRPWMMIIIILLHASSMQGTRG